VVMKHQQIFHNALENTNKLDSFPSLASRQLLKPSYQLLERYQSATSLCTPSLGRCHNSTNTKHSTDEILTSLNKTARRWDVSTICFLPEVALSIHLLRETLSKVNSLSLILQGALQMLLPVDLA